MFSQPILLNLLIFRSSRWPCTWQADKCYGWCSFRWLGHQVNFQKIDYFIRNWIFSWKNPEVLPLYYTIKKKEDSQAADWIPLTDHKIEPEEASYLSKNAIGTKKEAVEKNSGSFVKPMGKFELTLGCINHYNFLKRENEFSFSTLCILWMSIPPPLIFLSTSVN